MHVEDEKIMKCIYLEQVDLVKFVRAFVLRRFLVQSVSFQAFSLGKWIVARGHLFASIAVCLLKRFFFVVADT